MNESITTVGNKKVKEAGEIDRDQMQQGPEDLSNKFGIMWQETTEAGEYVIYFLKVAHWLFYELEKSNSEIRQLLWR